MNIKTNDTEKCAYALQDLYNVYDPEIGLNIVDLGLIYGLYFDEINVRIQCLMTLTTQFCPMGEAITTDTHDSLVRAFPGWEVIIKLTFEPPWDFSMISPEGKAYLGH